MNGHPHFSAPVAHWKLPRLGLMFMSLLLGLALACNLQSSSKETTPEDQNGTTIATKTQQKMVATNTSVSIQPTPVPLTETPVPTTEPVQPTPEPSTDTLTPTQVPPTSTDTPLPPSPTPTPSNTPIPPTPTQDVEALIKSAKILLYEDLYCLRYVKPALDEAGYSYTDVVDRMGDFKKELLSGKPWDLIIAASEARGGVQGGEFFEYIGDYLDLGAAVIVEMWFLDDISEGKIKPILDTCGIKFQQDWDETPSRSIYWLDPNHPLFHFPNAISLTHFVEYWHGDLGDFVRMGDAGDAVILGGYDPSIKDRFGLLTTCYGGRLILQTFSTHDHLKEDAIAVWQNYIYFTLKNHFEAIAP
jgi:hypothetical protein